MTEEQKEMTRVQLIREWFYRQGTDTMATFAGEIKSLNEADRNELAELIAKELNVRIKS